MAGVNAPSELHSLPFPRTLRAMIPAGTLGDRGPAKVDSLTGMIVLTNRCNAS